MDEKKLLCFCVFFVEIFIVHGQTQQELTDYLAAKKCQTLGVSQPPLPMQNTNNMMCGTARAEDLSTKVYYDDQKLMVGETTVYTAFQGVLNYQDNTPKYCKGQNEDLKSFYIKFSSNTLDSSIRTEVTTCRSQGFYTNGKEMCIPPECSKYQNVPKETDYFQDELYVTYNMRALATAGSAKDVIVTQFESPKDPRLVYNSTSNTTMMLTTNEFFDYCTKHGPCYGGKFLGNAKLFYSYGGFPQLLMKIEQANTFIGMRYDPRPFCLIEKQQPRPCMYKNQEYELCNSPAGLHSWRKLWTSSLPYKKEWLSLHWYVRWSHNYDCIIKVTDTETKDVLVDYTGPCGRTKDMEMGNYPHVSVGVFSKGMDVPLSMTFKDIKFNREGPVSHSNVVSASFLILMSAFLLCKLFFN